MPEPLIIECALNEQVTREQSRHVPISDAETVADALEAADAGAAIIHFHARDIATGDLLHPGLDVYRRIMQRMISSSSVRAMICSSASSFANSVTFATCSSTARWVGFRSRCC